MKMVTLILSLFFSFTTMAQVKSNVCSKITKVCAEYQSEIEFTSKQEGRFLLTLKSSDQIETEFIKVDLWMQMGSHGHGSSPLKITPVAVGGFDVTKAYFVMRGEWQIRVTYKQGVTQETLIIPVMIKE